MEIKEILIKNISSEHNIRQIPKEEKLESLMQTIKDNGLLQPIGVKETNKDTYTILWGNRRLAACKKLGWKSIPSVVFAGSDEEMTEEEIIVINGIENLQQSPNTIFEIGKICRILKKTMSVSEIAVRLGMPKERIKASLDEFSKIPAKWQKKIKVMPDGRREKQGNIPISHAMRVARSRGLTIEQRNNVLEYISKNDINLSDVEVLLSLVRSGLTISEAVKNISKYVSTATQVYFRKDKLMELMKTHKTRVDIIVYALKKTFGNNVCIKPARR